MTVEEKAKEYSNSEGIYNEHGERLLYMGYLAGYKDATRWRDPKEEPPPTPRSLGKTMYRVVVTTGGDYDPTLDTVCEYPNRGGIYFVVYRDKVTGWKPIE